MRGGRARRQQIDWGGRPLTVWRGPGFFAILNVAVGSMNWVGPSLELADRPPAPEALWPRRLPGVFSLSGLRQRTGIAFEDRASIEDEYVRTRTWKKDLALALRSLLLCWLPASPPACPALLNLFGLQLANPSMSEALDQLQLWTHADLPRQVAFINAHCVNLLHQKPDYAAALQHYDWLLSDGFGVRLAGLALSQPIKDNVNGTDLFPALCKRLEPEATRLFLFGARPGVAEAVAEWIQKNYPALQVVGCHDGYLHGDQEERLLQQLQELRPQLTLVALGVPAQELWLERHRHRLPGGLYLAVGGLFDFYSGRTARAPLWLREMGLEWTFRLLQEPGRMWRRYLVGNLIFAAHVWREASKQRSQNR